MTKGTLYLLNCSFGFFLLILLNLIPNSSISSDFNVSTNTFGVPGIIDMPTAGSFKDGQLGLSSSRHGPNFRNTLTFQALPRALAAFRYSGVGDRNLLFIGSGYANWDRSFDLRVDILKQNTFLPDLTLGVQDLIGTGMYSGEYAVASKTIFESLRLTAGLGWGRLATDTSRLVSKTGIRSNTTSALGGVVNYKRLFRGDVASFGGIEYQTPFSALKLKAEISSDDYSNDRYLSKYVIDDNFNYGADIKLNDSVDVSAYYINKREIGLRIKISADPSTNPGNFMETVPQPFYSIPIPEKDIENDYINELIDTLESEKIILIAHKSINNIEQEIIIENNHYSTHSQAIGRTLRIMSRFVPISISKFTVILSEMGIPITKISIDRNEVASIIDAPNAEILSLRLVEIKAAPRIIEDAIIKKNQYPETFWSIYPYYRMHLFDPNKPFYHDIGPRIRFGITPKPGFTLSGSIDKSLTGSFNEINRGAKGSLPHVRTELRHYLNVQDTRVRTLTAASYFKLSRQTYGRVTAGYLEPMFAGISSEMLYFPIKSKIAFGAELNYVKARHFRQLFGFREVSGMPKMNGHLTGYWDTGFYYYNAKLDVGRYLAGDVGSTLTLSREFPNGWKAGGFFSLTDATFKEFGEGSFDKGIFMTIPLNSILPYENRGSINERIKPIQGDGGAKLNVPLRLYEMVSDHSEYNIVNSWSTIWR